MTVILRGARQPTSVTQIRQDPTLQVDLNDPKANTMKTYILRDPKTVETQNPWNLRRAGSTTDGKAAPASASYSGAGRTITKSLSGRRARSPAFAGP